MQVALLKKQELITVQKTERTSLLRDFISVAELLLFPLNRRTSTRKTKTAKILKI